MFENKTYENLLQEKLKMVAPGFDKREGAVIYDALAPGSAEAAQIYLTLDWIFKQMFGDTADREYLCRIAYDTRGIRPKEATYAILKGVFNISIPVGTRFSIDEMNYIAEEVIGEEEKTCRLRCETAGTEGNRRFGSMIPVNYIPGLTTAELTELLIPGEDEEDTETFRKRWRNSFQSMAFGGNRADYREKIRAINGVGGVKVYRALNAGGEKKGGHVKCVVIDSDFRKPADLLINTIQNAADPSPDTGEGVGFAPIGHEVHVCPVKECLINIETVITYGPEYTGEDVRSYLEAAVDNYFLELNKGWEGAEGMAVRISQIESRLLEIKGIMDVSGTKLNGLEENILLDRDSIAVRGVLNG